MKAPLYDAHVHLADPRLSPYQSEITACYDAINLNGSVVVGTGPQDWPLVLERCAGDSRLVPAAGLHPWQVPHVPNDWQKSFLIAFEKGARAVGEIGLDCWVQGYDLTQQIPVFEFQLHFAVKNNLPVSIHALKATGPLMQILRAGPLPDRGFHLHAFNAPLELIDELVALGAYFSFNGGQLHQPAARARLLQTPINRLLIETDAPDFLPHPRYRDHELGKEEQPLCHPANLFAAYREIAAIRACPLSELALAVEENFKRFFIKAN